MSVEEDLATENYELRQIVKNIRKMISLNIVYQDDLGKHQEVLHRINEYLESEGY